MFNITTCDGCGAAVDEPVLVRTRRPSDPQDLCCVMAGCEDCFGPRQHPENHWASVPAVMTAEDWDRWVEAYGIAQNVLWLT